MMETVFHVWEKSKYRRFQLPRWALLWAIINVERHDESNWSESNLKQVSEITLNEELFILQDRVRLFIFI